MLFELVSATAASSLSGATKAMAGGVPLDFDRTVLLQIVVFAVLIVVLKPLLFDPMNWWAASLLLAIALDINRPLVMTSRGK